MDRLQIGNLRLTLLDGEARFNSPTLKTLDAVESYLETVQVFLEEWLQATQPPSKPPMPSLEEMTLRNALSKFATGLRRSTVWKSDIGLVLPDVAENLAPKFNIPIERARAIANDLLGTFK